MKRSRLRPISLEHISLFGCKDQILASNFHSKSKDSPICTFAISLEDKTNMPTQCRSNYAAIEKD